MRMQKFFLLIVGLVLCAVSCSRVDGESAVQVQDWLEALDSNAKVIEVNCTADVFDNDLGKWVNQALKNQYDAGEVLGATEGRGLIWVEIIRRMVDNTRGLFPDYYVDSLVKAGKLNSAVEKQYLANFKYKNLQCEGKALRSPPIQIPRCPNDTNGCDSPPNPTDQPPLPPPPGGGDF